MDKSKPCPFCGGSGVFETEFFMRPGRWGVVIVCEDCGAYGPPVFGINVDVDKDLAAEQAMDGWNARDEPIESFVSPCG